jgi:DNA-binding beta-propeller fold protein YncE
MHREEVAMSPASRAEVAMSPASRALTVVLLAVTAPAALPQQLSARPGVAERPTLEQPVRAALAPGGRVLVTDYTLKQVCTLAEDGRTIVDSFDVPGLPTALGVLGDRVFVGNEATRRVEIYALDGQPLGTLGGPDVVVEDPRDLAIDEAAQRLYVVDGLAREVKVFDLATPQGTLVAAIGGPGSTSVEFQHPTGIALDPIAQEVLVGDFGGMNATTKPRVIVFGYDGSFHKTISGSGGPTGQYFARPQGMLIGSSGHLFIVDSWRGEVIVMDRTTGEQVASLGEYGRGTGKLLLPLGLVVRGPDEDLWVTSASSQRVQRFEKGGQL